MVLKISWSMVSCHRLPCTCEGTFHSGKTLGLTMSRAAKRRQSAAHGASHGSACVSGASPGGAKENVAWEYSVAFCFLNAGAEAVDRPQFPRRFICLSRRHRAWNERDGAGDQRYLRSRPFAGAGTSGSISGRDCPGSQGELVALGAREMEIGFRLAERIRRV